MSRALLLVITAAIGCGTEPTPPAGPPPPPEGETLRVEIGPVPLAAREERTVCRVIELPTDEPVMLRGASTRISGGSHHFVVYRTSNPSRPEPYPCSPFVDLIAGSAPLLVAQGPTGSMEYPEGVGVLLEPRQRLRLELHAIDTSGAAGAVSAEAMLEVVPADGATIEADFYVAGIGVIEVPPRGSETDSTFARPPPPDPSHLEPFHLFALTSHMHHFGVRATVERVSGIGDPAGEVLHESLDWADPPTERFDPPLVFDGSDGLRLTCEWDNPTDATVTFGESANDEMCFLIGLYWPSRGFLVGLR